MFLFFFSSRRRHTRCALVTGVQTCALPICTKLSYKDARRLEELGTQMPKLQGDIAKLDALLADPGLYTRDPAEFARITARHDVLRAELEHADEPWLELEMNSEELSGPRPNPPARAG